MQQTAARLAAVVATASFAATLLAATPKAAPKKSTNAKASPAETASSLAAPDSFPHPIALFLASLCGDGSKRVAYKATAVDKRFFFEEASGVTVYLYDGARYKRETFLKGLTLDKAVKRYQTTKASLMKTSG